MLNWREGSQSLLVSGPLKIGWSLFANAVIHAVDRTPFVAAAIGALNDWRICSSCRRRDRHWSVVHRDLDDLRNGQALSVELYGVVLRRSRQGLECYGDEWLNRRCAPMKSPLLCFSIKQRPACDPSCQVSAQRPRLGMQ